MPATVSHVLSATTPNDPAFEIQPQHWNSNHLITINAVGSEVSGAFGNGGGVSFGVSADGKLTAAAPAGAPSPINFSAGTTSSNIGSVVFADSNGISWQLDGSTITATVKTAYIGLNTAKTAVTWTVNSAGISLDAGGYLTTARASTDAVGLVTAKTNVTWTVNSAGISLDAGGYATTNSVYTAISGIIVSDATYTSGSVSFSNAGNITINSSVNGATQYIKLSGNAAQTNQSAIKGFGVSNTGQTAGNTGISTGIDWVIAGSNLITMSQSTAGGGPNTVWVQHPAWLTTARGSTDAVGLNTAKSNVTWTVNSSGISLDARGYAGTGTSATNASITLDSNGLAISVASPAAGIALYDGANSISTGTARFTNANGVSFTFNGQTISGSVLAQSNQSAIKGFGVSNTGATAGNTGLSTGIDWVMAGSNLITLSQSTAGGGPNTVWIQHPAWLTTARGSTDAIGLNTAKTNVTWTANSSGLSFDAGGYAGTASGFTGTGVSATFTHNTVGLSLNLAISAIKGFGVSNTGNTAGNTGISTGVDWVMAGSGVISLSQSTAANSNTVWIQAPATSSIVGTNGISISTAGSTISVQPQWISSYENMEGMAGSSALTWGGTSISHAVAFMLPWPISGSFVRLPALMTTNSTTIATMASATASAQGGLHSTLNFVVYSLGVGANSNSLQSVASGSAGYTFSQKLSVTNSTQGSYSLGFTAQANGASTTRTTQYSVSNTNYSFTTDQIATEWSSNRFLDIPFASSLSPGAYWAVIGMSSSTSSAGAAGLAALTNCNVRYSNHYGISQGDFSFGVMGSTNRTSGGFMGAGSFSTAGGGTTNSLDMSNISSIASLARMYFQILRSA